MISSVQGNMHYAAQKAFKTASLSETFREFDATFFWGWGESARKRRNITNAPTLASQVSLPHICIHAVIHLLIHLPIHLHIHLFIRVFIHYLLSHLFLLI